jgi:NAD(P)-dependent dehydrogenase (short-subunit alcohol dehydrogenase family)
VTHVNALGTAIFLLANELELTFHCAINAGSQAVVLPLERIRKLAQSGTRMNLKNISRLVAATLAASFLYRRLAPRDSFAGRVIDALINNAGEIVAGPLNGMTREHFRNALDIHFWAPPSLTFVVLPHLRKSQVGWYWPQLRMALGCWRSRSEDCHEEVPSRGFRCLRQWLYCVLRRGCLLEFLA